MASELCRDVTALLLIGSVLWLGAAPGHPLLRLKCLVRQLGGKLKPAPAIRWTKGTTSTALAK